jgi:hypothetical protein
MLIAFPVGTVCLSLLLFFAGALEKPFSRLRLMDILFHLLPALLGAIALAAVGSLLWPLSVPFYFYQLARLGGRIRRELRRDREEAAAPKWPLSVEAPPRPTEGIEFPRTASAPGVCPVCMEVVSEGEARVCPRCGTVHHIECWDFQGGCGRYACEGQ